MQPAVISLWLRMYMSLFHCTGDIDNWKWLSHRWVRSTPVLCPHEEVLIFYQKSSDVDGCMYMQYVGIRYQWGWVLCIYSRRTGQLLSNHVSVEIVWNIRCFDREGLRQLQLHYNCRYYCNCELKCCNWRRPLSYISICSHCYVTVQQLLSPTYAVALSLCQTTIYSHHLLYTQETLAPVSSAGLAVRRAEVSQ